MTERELGELSARVTTMEENLQALARDTREIRDALLTLRGGKLMLIGDRGRGLDRRRTRDWNPALSAR